MSYIQQKGREDNWIGHILRGNFLITHITEEKIEGLEVTKRRGRECQ